MSKKKNKKGNFVVVYDGFVAIRIARKTDVPGYTIGVLEPFLLSYEEMNKMTELEIGKWVEDNNKLLESVCKFLNEQHG